MHEDHCGSGDFPLRVSCAQVRNDVFNAVHNRGHQAVKRAGFRAHIEVNVGLNVGHLEHGRNEVAVLAGKDHEGFEQQLLAQSPNYWEEFDGLGAGSNDDNDPQL